MSSHVNTGRKSHGNHANVRNLGLTGLTARLEIAIRDFLSTGFNDFELLELTLVTASSLFGRLAPRMLMSGVINPEPWPKEVSGPDCPASELEPISESQVSSMPSWSLSTPDCSPASAASWTRL